WKKLDDVIFSDEAVVDYDVYWDENRGLLHIFPKRYFEQISYGGKRQVKIYENLIDAVTTEKITLQAESFYRKYIYNE
ncbi:MAG TPA: hypothetical protein IAC62_17905, partial [Candidatus Pelethocola excrementipullorum]|nr:hypothetical protein [Candidatus Pelethocola excrementipullorum]